MVKTYTYLNGNYIVFYKGNNYQVKRALRKGEDLESAFPDSIDLKITNKCSHGCKYCHESSTVSGKTMNLGKTKEILSCLPEYPIEIAIGGGNVFDCVPEAMNLVEWLMDRGNLPRVTINYLDTKKDYTEEEKKFIDTVPAWGISIEKLPEKVDPLSPYNTWGDPYFDDTIWEKKNIVFHIIAGIFPEEDFMKLYEESNHPILILGYKQWGRAKNDELPLEKIKRLGEIVKDIITKRKKTASGNVISFDNLAIEQLGLRDYIEDSDWEMLYMGDEGTHSMYVDAVQGQFAQTSRSGDRISWDTMNLIEYFNHDKHNN